MRDLDPQSEIVRRAAMFQGWRHLTFLHWRYPVEALRRLVPNEFEIDTFDDSDWVGVTPFILTSLRPPLMPRLPRISTFPETNCRTYVKGPDGHSGIWFFSLDAARSLAVLGARFAYGLPYAWSRMRVTLGETRVTYESTRLWPEDGARTRIVIDPGEAIEAGPLERFLTARFRLYSFLGRRLTYTSVEHETWPLQSARIVEIEQNLTERAGLPPSSEAPLAHFTAGVTTRIAWPKSLL